MGKVLEFRRIKKQVQKPVEFVPEQGDFEEDVAAILGDYSLTPANRRWLLENMLMEIDQQLDEYKRELESAERKLDGLVQSAQSDILSAYGEFETHVRRMTHAVEKLTWRRRAPRQEESLPH